MKHAPVLIACLTFALLAGCIGYPPGAVRAGDLVNVRYDAYDLATGELVLKAANATLTIGGPPALGYDVSHALLGHTANETVRVESRGDRGRDFSDVVSVARALGPPQRQHQSVARAQTPDDVAVGKTYDLGTMRATITAVNDTTVLYDLAPLQARNEVPSLGLAAVAELQGEAWVTRVEPMSDHPVFAGPIGGFLPAEGMYRVRGIEGDNVTFDHSPLTVPALFAHDLRFEVTILRVQHAPPAPANVDGQYGKRDSPQVGRDPRGLGAMTSSASASPTFS